VVHFGGSITPQKLEKGKVLSGKKKKKQKKKKKKKEKKNKKHKKKTSLVRKNQP